MTDPTPHTRRSQMEHERDAGDVSLLNRIVRLTAERDALRAQVERARALAEAAQQMLDRGVIWRNEIEREFQAPMQAYAALLDASTAYRESRKATP